VTKRDDSKAHEDSLRSARPRVFGALRGVVEVGARFFQPLPIAKLYAWEGGTQRFREPSLRKQLAVALKAFWKLADTWRLTPAEQCALLAVSRRTLARWRVKPPAKRAVTLDRLRLILLTHERLEAVFAPWHGMDSAIARWWILLPGTAHNPNAPKQSVLEMLSERSVLTILQHYRRLEEHFRSAAYKPLAPPPNARGNAARSKRSSAPRDSNHR
jgi:hypothetical protein